MVPRMQHGVERIRAKLKGRASHRDISSRELGNDQSAGASSEETVV
jgi:hypothetical protein